jgi:predicted dehydrogenase
MAAFKQAGSVMVLRVLVAGAGRFGREHLTRLIAREDVEVVGVADPRVEALEGLAVARRETDALRLIAQTPADAVVIATPAASHVALAEAALRAGLGVLLEKPVANSAEGARALLAAQAGSRGFLLPGHVLRFCAHHRRLIACVRAGLVGEVLYINSRRYRGDDHAEIYTRDDPILMTLVHDIDLAQWVTGGRFAGVLARRSAGRGFRALTALSARTEGGVICDLRTAWTFPGAEAPPDRLEVVGDRGSVELTVGQGLCLYSEGRRTGLGLEAADDALSNEHDHFLARIADRSLPAILGLAEAIAGLRLSDAALLSLRLGREVEAPLL